MHSDIVTTIFKFRRRELLVDDEELEWIDLGADTLAFRRGSGVMCVINFGTDPIPLPDGDLLLTSSPLPLSTHLPPDTGAWLATRS